MNQDLEKREIEQLMESLKLGATVPAEQYVARVKSAIQDRSITVYCIWKKLKELHPEIDADEVMQQAAYDFGVVKKNQLVQKMGGEQGKTPKDVMKACTSDSSIVIFQQKISALSNERAVKEFGACPHVEAFQALGATPEEIRHLCRNILCYNDYGNLTLTDSRIIEFPSTVADGDGKCCVMTFVRSGAQ